MTTDPYNRSPFIIFLDIDGVLCTYRAHLAAGNPKGVMDEWDKVGVDFLRGLLEVYEGDVKLVISSSWRNFCTNPSDLSDILGVRLRDSGLVYYVLMPDWKTKSINNAGRGKEIEEWLSRHPEVGSNNYLILDDDDFDLLPEQKHRTVTTDTDNGISAQNMVEVKRIIKEWEISCVAKSENIKKNT